MPRQPAVTREAILKSTRLLMVGGNFRPTAARVVAADGFSERSIRAHFPTLEDLYVAAIDPDTAHAVVSLLPVTDEIALAKTIVLGRVP